jgi:hypothetical protein
MFVVRVLVAEHATGADELVHWFDLAYYTHRPENPLYERTGHADDPCAELTSVAEVANGDDSLVLKVGSVQIAFANLDCVFWLAIASWSNDTMANMCRKRQAISVAVYTVRLVFLGYVPVYLASIGVVGPRTRRNGKHGRGRKSCDQDGSSHCTDSFVEPRPHNVRHPAGYYTTKFAAD